MIWHPDTCDCIIEINHQWKWISTIQNCRLHSNQRAQGLLNNVMAQNRRFNYGFPDPQTDNQREIIQLSRTVNKLRIQNEPTKNNPNFDEHLPFEKPLSFFQNLRRVLRLRP